MSCCQDLSVLHLQSLILSVLNVVCAGSFELEGLGKQWVHALASCGQLTEGLHCSGGPKSQARSQ